MLEKKEIIISSLTKLFSTDPIQLLYILLYM